MKGALSSIRRRLDSFPLWAVGLIDLGILAFWLADFRIPDPIMGLDELLIGGVLLGTGIYTWNRLFGPPSSLAADKRRRLAEVSILHDEIKKSAGVAGVAGDVTRLDGLLEGIRKVQSYGMEVMGGFIVGFDNDPDNIFDKQIEFIRASAIPLAMVGLLTAAPHTKLWRRLEREGRLLTGFTGNNTDGVLNFVPRMGSTLFLTCMLCLVDKIPIGIPIHLDITLHFGIFWIIRIGLLTCGR